MNPSWWWPSPSTPLLLLALLPLLAGFVFSKWEYPAISIDTSYPLPSTQGQQGFRTQQSLRALPAPDEYLVGPYHVEDCSRSPISSAYRPGARNILSSQQSCKHDIAIVAFMDGMVYLVDNKSHKIQGSFSSGPSLSTSYQALSDDDTDTVYASRLGEHHGAKSNGSEYYFIDCGEDWNLYEHSKEFDKRKVPITAKEYVNLTPIISVDGSITLGSKNSTVFLVDASSGNVIRRLSNDMQTVIVVDNNENKSNDIQTAVVVDNNENKPVLANLNPGSLVEVNSAADKLLVITRTDYALSSYNEDFTKRLWSMTVAEFSASMYSQGVGSGLSSVTGDDLGWEGGLGRRLQCPKIDVFRVPDNNPFQLNLNLPKVLRLPDPIHDGEVHAQSAPIQNPLASFVSNDGQIDAYVSQKSQKMNGIARKTFSIPGRSSARYLALGGSSARYLALGGSSAWYLVLPFVIVLLCYLWASNHMKSDKTSSDFAGKQVPKRRKTRKASKIINGVTVSNHHISKSEETIQSIPNELPHLQTSDGLGLMSLLKAGEVGDGRWVGKLFVSNTVIAKGSNGTIVLEGFYDGRAVAVKRLVRAYHGIAFKEIQNLIASDHHPNIVRWFGVEYDLNFVYLSLERCTCSLSDLIQLYSDSSSTTFTESPTSSTTYEYIARLGSIKGINKDVELWKPDGFPSSQLLNLMRDVVSGLAHLHELGIIHRDIKPQNVLINSERSLSAKLSDMGISKRLPEDMSSLGHHATGHGSFGWQAPELLLHGRQTRALDVFSLGCVLFFCITKGKHPFGSYFERDSNILSNRVDLFLVEHIPEAIHLFSHLLAPDPEHRPNAQEVLQHPLFWSSEMRLSFLRDASDRFEIEDREKESELLTALESISPMAFGRKWDEKLDAPFISDMGRYRKYKFDCTRDLLRVIRNKLNHYREIPRELQEILGAVPEGFDSYFTRRFPKLLIEVYSVMYRHCREEDCFQKYFKP